VTSSATEHAIPLRDLVVHLEERGAGPPVLLAHGMWCDGGMFARLATELARDHRVLVPDLRGHGRTTVPATQWEIGDLALDLVALLDHLEIERVTLLGFSMGGMAAIDLAIHFPKRLEALALVGTSAAAEELLRALEIRALARIIQLTGQARYLAREAARSTFSPSFRKADPAAVARWESSVRAMEDRALIQALHAVASRPSLLERLDEITVTSVIAAGGADRVLKPRWSKAMHRRLRRSKLVIYPKTGHAVPTERPLEMAALVRGLGAGGRA